MNKPLIVLFFILSLMTSTSYGQKTVYVSAADQDLSIKNVVVAPVTDNVSGIYSKPLESHLKGLINFERYWSLQIFPQKSKATPDDFEQQTKLVIDTLAQSSSQGLFTLSISKGPNGLAMKLRLYTGASGLLFAQEELVDYQAFDIADARNQLENLYGRIKAKLPYDGLILSRRNQQVTLNYGSILGAKPESELTVIQIIKVNRHPKLKFVIGTEKEIIGKIRLTKVEEYLSFGTILSEKEVGTITVGAKVMGPEMVQYKDISTSADGKILDKIAERPDADVSFGDKAREWIPDTIPTFGKIAILAGLGNYQYKTALTTAGSLDSSKNLVPNIGIETELWINPRWNLHFDLRQGVTSLTNPLADSNPQILNVSTSKYSLLGGYNFLIADDFFGPKIELKFGFSSASTFVDSSVPLAFTSTTYAGFIIGVGGSFPLEESSPIIVGANLNYYYAPTISESPKDSGGGKSTVAAFDFFGEYKLKQKFRIKGSLNFDQYSSTFAASGTRTDPATSASQSSTTLMGGVVILF